MAHDRGGPRKEETRGDMMLMRKTERKLKLGMMIGYGKRNIIIARMFVHTRANILRMHSLNY